MYRRSVRRIVRYPSMTLLVVGLPIVFLLLFVYVFGGTLGAGLGAAIRRPGGVRRLRHAGHPADDGRRDGTGHRHLGRHGRDRRDHRPVPDDGHRAGLGADRSRARQPDPDA